ncbi:MAG: polyribonucleotide nucleotidyltransferase [Corynebacterium sp.]|nr:polyribonucleotide nucleotidyltransferase [Corynebacterium sp.]
MARNSAKKKDVQFYVDEEFHTTEVTALIDNGDFGTRTIRFETGQLAKQADGAVVTYLDDDTMMLATTTASHSPREGFDFFPLTVDVEERMYAAGKIPGSFFRREGRPSTEAILACRVIDRPLRPTFVKGLRNEVQIIVTVLSVDPKEHYDVVAINGASAATQISGLPVVGAVGGVRMALVADADHPQGQWVAFPDAELDEKALFEIVVAGRRIDTEHGKDVAIMMVEAGASAGVLDRIAEGGPAPTEEVVAEGLEAAKPFIDVLCRAQEKLTELAAKPVRDFPIFEPYTEDILARVRKLAQKKIGQIMSIADKLEREEASAAYIEEVVDALTDEFVSAEEDDTASVQAMIRAAFTSVTKEVVRGRILTSGKRIDGRELTSIRELEVEVELIPRAHGSSLFQRGETQIMGVTTLDNLKMEQSIDALVPQTSKRYMHHYNFPPYSTGETGRVGSPKRREIGHGNLAERALIPVIPSREDFPYAIRQVSETLGSNGSSSMGSVCASTLSLLNAGVPLKGSVAGIAMGLISGEVKGKMKYVTLTDILGAEDALGDMDFKVAGTREFVTALQLDTKLDGIPSDVLASALKQAREARFEILDTMAQVIDAPDEMSQFAPRITTITVPVSKIGEVIGPKGKTINQITEETGVDVSIEEDGTVYISASSGSAADQAIEMINNIANPQMPKVGEHYVGTVVKLAAFGAFVSILPGRDGLVHISEFGKIRGERLAGMEGVVEVGEKLEVEVIKVDDRGKLSLRPINWE